MFVACIGNFDGVHLGHRSIMKKTVELSKKMGMTSTAISIIYPWGYYFPNFSGLIYPVSQRVQLIFSTGIENVITTDMAEIRHLSPEEYIERLMGKGIKGIVVGRDFTFGKMAAGNADTLKEFSQKYNFTFEIVDDVHLDSKRISSSWIRELIAKGEIKTANKLLETPYCIYGTVYSDQKLGRKLGFPTANIARESENLVNPRPGVYIARSSIENTTYYGLLNIGFRPTVKITEDVRYEMYYFDYSGNLYDKKIEVEILDFLRPELKFDSLEKLIEQIHHDESFGRSWVRKYIKDKK